MPLNQIQPVQWQQFYNYNLQIIRRVISNAENLILNKIDEGVKNYITVFAIRSILWQILGGNKFKLTTT